MNVMNKLIQDVGKAAFILTVIEKNSGDESLAGIRIGLLDGLGDMAEVLDSYRQDLIDVLDWVKAEL